MLYRVSVALCRLLLRVFFRRIEVVGSAQVPADGAVLFVLNHPSGLIDPLFILRASRRKVSFLAKEPLFRMPVVGLFVRAFECLPVYRSSDGGDPARNRAMMQRASQLLFKGNALAIFPEGTSHSDPSPKPFRSGAARIALCAANRSRQPVSIVPAGIYYEQKETFRSRAVLAFGPPVHAPVVELEDGGEAPRELAQQLTSSIFESVRRLIPNADTAEALLVAQTAERLLAAAELERGEQAKHPNLAARTARRRELLERYRQVGGADPRTTQLAERVTDVQRRFEALALPIDAPLSASTPWHAKAPRLVVQALALAPLGLPGLLWHYPAYRAVRVLAFQVAKDSEDILATAKLLAGSLLFVLTWLLCGVAIGLWQGPLLGAATALSGPLMAWAALRLQEVSEALQRRISHRRALRGSAHSWQELAALRAELARDIEQWLQRGPERSGP